MAWMCVTRRGRRESWSVKLGKADLALQPIATTETLTGTIQESRNCQSLCSPKHVEDLGHGRFAYRVGNLSLGEREESQSPPPSNARIAAGRTSTYTGDDGYRTDVGMPAKERYQERLDRRCRRRGH